MRICGQNKKYLVQTYVIWDTPFTSPRKQTPFPRETQPTHEENNSGNVWGAGGEMLGHSVSVEQLYFSPVSVKAALHIISSLYLSHKVIMGSSKAFFCC